MLLTGHSCHWEPPGCSGVVSVSTAPFPQAQPAPGLQGCVPCSHRVITGFWVGMMFCLPGTRPSHPTHHQPSLRVCQGLCQAEHAWPSPPALLPFLQEAAPDAAVAEQGDGPACIILLPLSSPAAVPPSPLMLLWPCSAELVFPRDANVFYGMNSHVNFDFILRKKAELLGWGCTCAALPGLGNLSQFPVENVQLEQWAALVQRLQAAALVLRTPHEPPLWEKGLLHASIIQKIIWTYFYGTEANSVYVCLKQLRFFCTCSTPENDPFWILFPKNFKMDELHLPLHEHHEWDKQTLLGVGWRS